MNKYIERCIQIFHKLKIFAIDQNTLDNYQRKNI